MKMKVGSMIFDYKFHEQLRNDVPGFKPCHLITTTLFVILTSYLGTLYQERLFILCN